MSATFPDPRRRDCKLITAAALALSVVLLGPLAATAARAADHDDGAVRLRGWHLGVQWTAGDRDRWDVFGRDDLPPAAVGEQGRGFGLQIGRRLGGRFLLGLQLAATKHDLAGLDQDLVDVEFLVTGTVLFRERSTLQPFVRGGFGGAGVVLEETETMPSTNAIGTAAVAGGGLQIRLGSRVSLEFEAVGTVTNVLEVNTERLGELPGEDWRVKTSHVGWRGGVGAMLWF